MARGKRNPITSFNQEYSFLSNFAPCTITYQGISYPTTEHAFVETKTLDLNKRQEIAKIKTPGQAKRVGRKLLLRVDWEDIKFSVMEDLLRLKFNQPKYRELLLATGDAQLIEQNNWHDRVWGACDGTGENNLGKLLMKIRDELLDEAK